MLALALTESAQQVSIQTQPFELRTPESPLRSQAASNVQDTPESRPVPQFEGAVRRGSPLPNTTSPTVTTPCTSTSPQIKKQPPELTSTISNPLDSSKSTRLDPEASPPDTPLNKCTPLSSSASLTFPSRKSPERQQTAVAQAPLCSSTIPANTPSSIYKDPEVLTQPEVSVISCYLIDQYMLCAVVNVLFNLINAFSIFV